MNGAHRRASTRLVIACLACTVGLIACGSPAAAARPGTAETSSRAGLGIGPDGTATSHVLAGSGPGASSAASGPRPARAAAPTSASGFKVRDTVVPMAFPLPASAHYRYGDGWRAPRDGVVYAYNLIRGRTPVGTLLRAHDGQDLLVPNGTLVVSPFDGVVIDPAQRWKPWSPGRYGTVVAIESNEPASHGYVALLVHLSKMTVRPGDTVKRGQAIGRTGQTGNARGTAPHLHFEIRAPFKLRYGYGGLIRYLDVFDPVPSLRAADPRQP